MEHSKFDIQFSDKKEDVINLLLSLNNEKDFQVTQLNDSLFEIIYDGGYNNVYNHKVKLNIIGLVNNVHNTWFYWKFDLMSKEYDMDFEVDNFGWNLGFMDFFIDSYIKSVGSILHEKDLYY